MEFVTQDCSLVQKGIGDPRKAVPIKCSKLLENKRDGPGISPTVGFSKGKQALSPFIQGDSRRYVAPARSQWLCCVGEKAPSQC